MKVVFALVFGLILPIAAWADDATDAADDALKAYKSGDMVEAARQWEYAAQLARQQRSAGMLDLLPGPLQGWTEDEAESTAVGGAMFGGGTNATKTFSKGDSSVTMSLSADNPMLAMFSMMANNPAMVSQSGQKPVTIEGQRGTLEYDKSERSGELTLVAYGKYLLQVNGDGVDADTLMEYAKGTDFDELSKR